MEEKPNYFAIVPANVRYDIDLNANAKLLYGEISALSNKYGFCLATNEYFSELYNVSQRTITDWFKKLEDKGYITTQIETKRYEDGTIKKIRKTYIHHIEENQHDHIEVLRQNHIEENFLYNNTSNINNINKKENIKRKSFVKPTLEEIKEYCLERKNNVDYQKFFDYYEINNWVDNQGNKVKNWKQKVITWEKNTPPTPKKEETLPTWFNKDYETTELTEEEKREIDEVLGL